MRRIGAPRVFVVVAVLTIGLVGFAVGSQECYYCPSPDCCDYCGIFWECWGACQSCVPSGFPEPTFVFNDGREIQKILMEKRAESLLKYRVTAQVLAEEIAGL